MVSLVGAEQLDEAHCFWALCSHPCCWEAEQRIAKGIYRRALRVPTKHSAEGEERLPSLTVVDVSEWAGMRTVSSDRTYLSRIPSQAVPPWKDTTPRVKTTDPSFPAITSAAAKPRTRESGTRAKGDNTAHISPLIGSPWGSGSLVLWVPNPRYIPQGFKSSKSPQCAVKELICLPAAQTQNTPKANHKRTTKKVRFQLTCSPLTFHPSQQAESVPPGQLEVGTGNASAVVEEPELPRDLSAILVKNKPVVFHSVRERRVRRARQDLPTSLYKLDSKAGEEDVDWDSLTGQLCLWKRVVPPELLSPPGGTRGTQEIVSSYPVSKASAERSLHGPQCADPAAWPYVKRAWRYGRDTHPLLSHKKHHQGTGSELDMTIRSTSAVTEHNQLHTMLDTDERRERAGGSKGSVTPLNSEFYSQRSTHQLYALTPGQI